MEIFLDKDAVLHIRTAVNDAIEEADTENLRDELLEAFTPSQIDELDRRVDGGDFGDALGELFIEWEGEDYDELLELLETLLGEAGVELKLAVVDIDEADDDDDEPDPREVSLEEADDDRAAEL